MASLRWHIAVQADLRIVIVEFPVKSSCLLFPLLPLGRGSTRIFLGIPLIGTEDHLPNHCHDIIKQNQNL